MFFTIVIEVSVYFTPICRLDPFEEQVPSKDVLMANGVDQFHFYG
jgi:hypothetical protein